MPSTREEHDLFLGHPGFDPVPTIAPAPRLAACPVCEFELDPARPSFSCPSCGVALDERSVGRARVRRARNRASHAAGHHLEPVDGCPDCEGR